MTYREAADILANKDPFAALMYTDFFKKKKEAERMAIELLLKEAEKMEKAEIAKYRGI